VCLSSQSRIWLEAPREKHGEAAPQGTTNVSTMVTRGNEPPGVNELAACALGYAAFGSAACA